VEAVGCAGNGPGMGEFHKGAQIFEQGALLQSSSGDQAIVLGWYYNRDYNELADFGLACES
jgi:hypothetical protein